MKKELTKKELRLQKKLEKLEKQKKKGVRLSSAVKIEDKYIRSRHKPDLVKAPRSPQPDNYKNHYFAWCCSQADVNEHWSWGEPRHWSSEEYTGTIKPHMDSHNNDSWSEVELKTYNGKDGYRKRLNKYQPLDSLNDEAKTRWSELELVSQFEEMFRLRLGDKKRIWGVRIQHHFYMVWYEREHKICPVH